MFITGDDVDRREEPGWVTVRGRSFYQPRQCEEDHAVLLVRKRPF
jgi:hypothetical protein